MNKSHSISNLETNFVVSSCPQGQHTVQSTSTSKEPTQIAGPSQRKCRGRGIIIQQLNGESTSASNIYSKNPRMNFGNSEIEQQFKNLRIKNTKNHKNENITIFKTNTKEKSHTTKLRGNSMLKSYSNDLQASSSMYTSTEPSDFSFNTQNQNTVTNTSTIKEPKQIFEPSQYKCGGRGKIIQQIEESINNCSKNLGMSFANSDIERHFKNLRDKASKELEEENEKKWGPMISSNKSS